MVIPLWKFKMSISSIWVGISVIKLKYSYPTYDMKYQREGM